MKKLTRKILIAFIALTICVELTIGALIVGVKGENDMSVKGDESSEIKPNKTGRNRDPRFGFNFGNLTYPGVMMMPGLSGTGTTGIGSGTTTGTGNLIGTLGTSALLLKGGLLGTLTALKAAILPPIFLGVLIAFLVAGAAFFTCSVLDCGSVLGGFGGLGGFGNFPFSPFGTIFSRNSFDYYDQQGNPVYQGLENGYKKYGEENHSGGAYGYTPSNLR